MARPLSNQIVVEPEAIEALLRDVMRRWVEGLITPEGERGWKVRCLLEHIVTLPSGRALVAGSISVEGLERLKKQNSLSLCFLDDWSKVQFQTRLLEISDAHAVMAMPERVEVYERRQYPRFRTSSAHASVRPVLLPQDDHLSSKDRAEVLDISVGGMCVATRSTDIVKRLRQQPEGIAMQLQLPEFESQEIACQLRWVRPEPIPEASSELTLGLAFHEPPRDFLLTVGRYIKRLQGTVSRGA